MADNMAGNKAEGAKFITFEGGEGIGKSTQIKLLHQRLVVAGIDNVTTREPGGSPGAEIIRDLLVSGKPGRWQPLTDTLLHFAARNEHLVNFISPTLGEGTTILCDRFVDSTRAYQGAAQGIDPAAIDQLLAIVVGDFNPDLTLILDLPVEVGLQRAAARQADISARSESPAQRAIEDRYERMGADFHQKLRAAFLEIAKTEPDRCVLIDASGTVEQVADKIWAAVQTKFPDWVSRTVVREK